MKPFVFILISLAIWITDIAGEQCNNYCKQTYPLHTFPKEQLFFSCIRGCRLGRINQLSGHIRNKDYAVSFCQMDCRHAYEDLEDLNACHIGCEQQDILPTPAGLLQAEMEKASFEGPVIHQVVLQPVRVFRRYCAGMMNNVVTFVAMQTAFVVEENGKETVTVSVEGGPVLQVDVRREDRTAQMVKVQAKPKKPASYYDRLYLHGSGWIDCVAAKAHLPPWLLTFALLVCFCAAAWLCCSAVFGSDAQDEKRYSFERIISAESVDSEKCPLFTVDKYEAPPLPTKTKLIDIA